MKTIYKYPFETEGEFTLSMPGGAEILAVQVQGETPCIWAMITIGKPSVIRSFRVYGTGHPIEDPDEGNEQQYIGTYQLHGGKLVFHLFEVARS